MRSAYHSTVYPNNDATTFSLSSFADAIKSRSHLITTQGEVKTDGTDSHHHRKADFYFFLSFFFLFFPATVDEDDGLLVVTSFYIYNSTVRLNDPSPSIAIPTRSVAPIV